jgi:hypothetical protein
MKRRSFLGLLGALPFAAAATPEAFATIPVPPTVPPMGHIPVRDGVVLRSAHADILWPSVKEWFEKAPAAQNALWDEVLSGASEQPAK